jgi:hypothetical protein
VYSQQQQKLQNLGELKNQIVEGRHKEASWCEQRFEELTHRFQQLRQRADKRKADLLAELERQKKIQEMLVSYAKTATVHTFSLSLSLSLSFSISLSFFLSLFLSFVYFSRSTVEIV